MDCDHWDWPLPDGEDGLTCTGDALIRFERIRQPVVLRGSARLLPAIDGVLAGWPHEVSRGGPIRLAPQAHRITLAFDGGIYSLESPWLRDPVRHRDPVNTVCDLVVQLVHGFVATNPKGPCLHSAAVRLGGRLIVFPNVYRDGKSLFAAHLASLGAEIFADDVMPIRGRANHGFALGLSPRLRLPLPDGTAPGFEAFVETHRGPSSLRYQYLDPGPDLLPPLGATAPIGAFVLLDRREGTAAALEPLSRPEALCRVVERNFARRAPARRILRRLERLVAATPCYRLVYGDAGHAACLIMARFAVWPEAQPPEAQPKGRAAIAAPKSIDPMVAPPRSRPHGPLRPSPEVFERRVEDALFLVNEETDSIHHLNPMAETIWRLAAQGHSQEDIIDLVAAAFPQLAKGRISRDVGQLVTSLVQRRLLLRRGREPRST